MAKDGDRHQLGDPVSRTADLAGKHGTQGALTDTTEPAQLTDEELRRQLANLDQIMREAPARGTPPDVTARVEERLSQLKLEHRRRNP